MQIFNELISQERLEEAYLCQQDMKVNNIKLFIYLILIRLEMKLVCYRLNIHKL